MRHPTKHTAVFVLLSLLASLLAIMPGTAQATSSYDNLLHTSPTLFVYTDGSAKSQTMDTSQSWYNDLSQAYAKRIAQNIGWPTNFMSELDAIRSSGGSLGLFMHEDANGNTVEVLGSRDPHASCGFIGDASTGSFQCSSHAGYGFIHAIGGNDIGFADFSKACVLGDCQNGSQAYNDAVAKLNTVQSTLEATYRKILQYAPNAKVYVAGYPQVMADMVGKSPVNYPQCAYMDNDGNWGNATAARSIVTQLDQKISAAVKDVADPRLNYVAVDQPGSLFIGHEICADGTEYFNKVNHALVGNQAYVFHPNQLGQQAYATMFASVINGS